MLYILFANTVTEKMRPGSPSQNMGEFSDPEVRSDSAGGCVEWMCGDVLRL